MDEDRLDQEVRGIKGESEQSARGDLKALRERSQMSEGAIRAEVRPGNTTTNLDELEQMGSAEEEGVSDDNSGDMPARRRKKKGSKSRKKKKKAAARTLNNPPPKRIT